jgi:hypothetical protein
MTWRPIGLLDVEDLTLSRQSAHRWRLVCQPYAQAVLCTRVIQRLEGLGKLKN